jgi:uncharacterized protein YjaG (DUF416 family)
MLFIKEGQVNQSDLVLTTSKSIKKKGKKDEIGMRENKTRENILENMKMESEVFASHSECHSRPIET